MSSGEALQQRTIAEKVTCSGVGLHSGAPVQLTLRPARANTGILFRRTDLPASPVVPAHPSSVASIFRATTLAREHTSVATVEHLLAALYALGVDNVHVDLDGPEVPVMDGSALAFVNLLRTAGIFVQRDQRAVLRVLESVAVSNGDSRIRIEPARAFEISYQIDFPHPAIRRQCLNLSKVNGEIFERELASARTFGFLEEVHALREAGLARGGSLENTVVLDAARVMNSEGLRWRDEFVRHKIVDLLGDLALLGLPIEGHVVVERGGHALHQRLVSELLDRSDAWEISGEAEFPHGLSWDSQPAAVVAS